MIIQKIQNLKNAHIYHSTLIATDAVIFAVSFALALQLTSREVANVYYGLTDFLWMVAVVLTIKLLIFFYRGFYREVIRFISVEFAAKIVKYTVFSSLISITFIHLIRPNVDMSVLIVDWMASCILIGLSRFGLRYIQEGRLSKNGGRNTVLYGAGEHGAAVVRHLHLNDLGCRVVGFIDDSHEKLSKKIQSIPVLGDVSALPKILSKYSIEELIVTIANPDGDLVKSIFRACREKGVRCRIVPGMTDVISGNEVVRNIDIADLMRRPQRMLDKNMIAKFIKGQRVMITGAAGSIGSEIFRQVLSYEPKAVAAIDHSEYALYKLDEELASHQLKDRCLFSLVDIKHEGLVDAVFSSFRPNVVFHAAAYKHVPILEQDVRQAILNNVKGLRNVVNAAIKSQVSKFVFISTDKAVRPTNVMGATKRIGENIVLAASSQSGMHCVGVRFGNVLASSGSVVPKFIKQIKSGGPVTVTHAEVTRYFMLIPEAVELVLQAACLGVGGEVFVLDMGRPVRIAEMAEDLISLMGHVPHTGIPIMYTGLRPGEKLHEELFLGEIERTTKFKDINVGKIPPLDKEEFRLKLDGLLSLAEAGAAQTQLKEAIKQLVPEYMIQSCHSGMI